MVEPLFRMPDVEDTGECPVQGCEAKPGKRGYAKHWAQRHCKTVRRFLCPNRDEPCLHVTSNPLNMGRHVASKLHNGRIHGVLVDVTVACHKSQLKIGEYLNEDYMDPGDVPEPPGLQRYYMQAGLDPIDPAHKIDKHSLLLKTQSMMYRAARGLQVTVEVAKEEPTEEESDSELGAVGGQSASSSAVRRLIADGLEEDDKSSTPGSMPSLEPMTPPEGSEIAKEEPLVVDEVEQYVVVPSATATLSTNSQETTAQVTPSAEQTSENNVTTVRVEHVSQEESFNNQLQFFEEVLRRCRKRGPVSSEESAQKVARLEAQVHQKDDEIRYLREMLQEKDEHIKTLKAILKLPQAK